MVADDVYFIVTAVFMSGFVFKSVNILICTHEFDSWHIHMLVIIICVYIVKLYQWEVNNIEDDMI